MDHEWSRREFVGAGMALAAQVVAPRIGIIGLGNRSRAHLEALKQLPEARISALCDLDSQRIERVNAGLAAKAASYTDYRELIADRNVDAVVIVAPNFLHHEMVLAALKAGKDVLVEKPIAVNYTQAREMEREARRAGRILMVGMQRHFGAAEVKIRELVESGRIGPVRLITYEEYRGDWNPNSWKYADPATGEQTNWRFLKKTAGSSELEFSVHSYGFICSLVKSPLARASASGAAIHYPGRETRDVSTALVEFASGARLSHSFCLFAAGPSRTCVIAGDKGSLEWVAGKLTLRAEKAKPETVELAGAGDGAEVRLYREFFRCVREQAAPAVGTELAIEAAKIAYAAEISITQGRFVTAADFRG